MSVTPRMKLNVKCERKGSVLKSWKGSNKKLKPKSKSLKHGKNNKYSAAKIAGAATAHPSNAWAMLSKTSWEALPVKTFFHASDVKGK